MTIVPARTVLACAAALLVTITPSTSHAQVPPAYGPPTGHLVLAGGGKLEGTGVLERVIALAGGSDKAFIIVPTAAGTVDVAGAPVTFDEARVLAPWKALGVRNVRMLHTHDPRVADTAAFAAPLHEADAVWFDGGRQWRLVDAYADTRTLAGFLDVLARGGVIGGSSAGATIQGQYLVRGATAGSEIVMTDEPNHQAGFAFLRRSAIDQHIDTRNRWDDLTPVVQRFPDLLGVGLSEGTAIVVDGDRFEVIGRGQVAVHDPTHAASAGEKPYLVLDPGDAYDMRARRVVTKQAGTGPARP